MPSADTKVFRFTVGAEEVLGVEDIWPDGDAPENPTVDDVIARVRESASSGAQLMREWNFDCYVEVNGKDAGLR